MTRNAIRIARLMKVSPHCHWCGILVIYYKPEFKERVPHNFATIDHLHSRFQMEKRLEAWRESMKKRDGSHYVLACWACNQRRSSEEVALRLEVSKHMAEDFSNLEDYAKGGSSQFVKFDEANTPIEGMYLGYELEDDSFNPGEKKVVYNIEINQEKKSLSSGSKRLARAVLGAKPEVGHFIKITKIPGATQYDTTFDVQTSDLPF